MVDAPRARAGADMALSQVARDRRVDLEHEVVGDLEAHGAVDGGAERSVVQDLEAFQTNPAADLVHRRRVHRFEADRQDSRLVTLDQHHLMVALVG